MSNANAEQIHSSNKHVTYTAMFGIMTPEKQTKQLVYRNDGFTKQDIQDRQQQALIRASQLNGMLPGSLQYKAIFALSNYGYDKLFIPAFSRMGEYRKLPRTANGGKVIGHNVNHLHSPHVSFILIGERCLNPRCIGNNTQCVHKVIVDQRFIIMKCDSRWFCDEKYDSLFGVSCAPTQLNKDTVQLGAQLPATTVLLKSASVSH